MNAGSSIDAIPPGPGPSSATSDTFACSSISKETVANNLNGVDGDAPREGGHKHDGGEDDDYDTTDDIDVEMLKPTPKLPDAPPKLPDSFLPLDADASTSLSDSLDTVFFSSAGEGETSRVGKRASAVLKLAQEKDELMAKLHEMTERLEAAERRRAALEARRGGASDAVAAAAAAAPPPSSFRGRFHHGTSTSVSAPASPPATMTAVPRSSMGDEGFRNSNVTGNGIRVARQLPPLPSPSRPSAEPVK